MKTEREINHEKCIEKVRKALMEENPEFKYIYFDMSSIVSWDENNKKSKYHKTGQRITIGYHDKKGNLKERKSFTGHLFCPFCGKQFTY